PGKRFSTVVTDSFTHRTYVATLLRYVPSGTDGSLRPLATCAWSHLPEVASPRFLELLVALHRCGHHKEPATLFAQLCGWLVHEVPAPPPGTALLLHGIAGAEAGRRTPICAVSRPPPGGPPGAHVPLRPLLTRLGVSSLLLVARLLLLEQKVVFVSSSVALLTSACEAFSTLLLFPLAWVHCYNPLLPSTDYLGLPPPFLFGSLREVFCDGGTDEGTDLGATRDFSVFDLDTGEVNAAPEIDRLPSLPEAAESRLRFGLTELRASLEATNDVLPMLQEEGDLDIEEESFEDAAQQIFLSFTAEILGDVPCFLGNRCQAATPSSVSSSFQGSHFLSSVSKKDKPFYASFLQTSAFLAHLQTLHLYGPRESPFAEALQSFGSHECREDAAVHAGHGWAQTIASLTKDPEGSTNVPYRLPKPPARRARAELAFALDEEVPPASPHGRPSPLKGRPCWQRSPEEKKDFPLQELVHTNASLQPGPDQGDTPGTRVEPQRAQGDEESDDEEDQEVLEEEDGRYGSTGAAVLLLRQRLPKGPRLGLARRQAALQLHLHFQPPWPVQHGSSPPSSSSSSRCSTPRLLKDCQIEFSATECERDSCFRLPHAWNVKSGYGVWYGQVLARRGVLVCSLHRAASTATGCAQNESVPRLHGVRHLRGSACKFAHGVGELRRPVLGGERLAAESKTMETFSALSLDSETHEELGECGHAKNSNNNNNDALGFGDQTLDSESASTMSSESPKGKDRAIHRLKAQTQSGRPMQAHLKTRYCKFFREGRCLRGELCMFAHAKQDIRPEPYLFRTSPCFDFLRHGSCRVGDDCKFAHSLEDLRGNELTGRKDSGMLGAPASTDLSDYLPQASFLSQTSSESVGSLRTYIPSAQDDDNHNNKWHDESSMRSSTADVEQFNMASNNGSSDDAQVRATLELMVEAQPSRVQATHFASRRLNNNNNSNSNSNSSIIEELLASRVSSISI
ncbi:unnamed protein product, partial [Polarella glacialis]